MRSPPLVVDERNMLLFIVFDYSECDM